MGIEKKRQNRVREQLSDQQELTRGRGGGDKGKRHQEDHHFEEKGGCISFRKGGGNFEGSNLEDELTEGTFIESKKLRWGMGV